jgi:Xaa-Pro aminopeptidase
MQKDFSLAKAYSQVFVSSCKHDSREIYRARRRALMEKLDSACVFAGMPVEPGGEEAFTSTWTKFVQEPAFLFLTGVNQAGCFLLLDPASKSEVLFVPKKDPFKEFWVGKRIGYLEGDSDASRLTGVKDVRPAETFYDCLAEWTGRKGAKKFIYAFFHEKFQSDHNWKFKQKLERTLRPRHVAVRSVAALHWELRLPLDAPRIDEAKRAQVATDKAFRELLKAMPTFKGERDLGLFLDHQLLLNGDGDLAFPTIVASGENACCLHYVKKDEPLKKGSLVLLDFGTRVGTLHSDISRTIPVNGKFNPLQKMLYEIVLDSAAEYRKSVRPGVSLREIGNIPWDFIMEALESRLVKGACGTYELLYDRRPHGVSHFIGEQIHEGDPGSRSLTTVLEPGMMISCEPGLYGTFSATIGGKRYREKIGIRIEDDLLITKTGHVNLSSRIPKTVGEIEALMSSAKASDII